MPAQIKSPREEIEDLKKKIEELEDKVDDLQDDAKKAKKKKKEDDELFAGGLLTVGAGTVKFQIAGRGQFLFIETEDEDNPIVGSTLSPDPHLEVQRLRLAPVLTFNRDLRMHAHIDFRPGRGVRLKEIAARHRYRPNWWFRTDEKIGIDDRFIRPARRTNYYPVMGVSFWRSENLGLWWIMRFGDPDGKPEPESDDGRSSRLDLLDEEGELMPVTEAGVGRPELRPGRDIDRNPFDFGNNLGQLRTYFTLSNSPPLAPRSINFDRASFNNVIRDGRELLFDQALRQIAVGLGYRRNFSWLGEIEVLGFYYDDRLGDTSVAFLQQSQTIRDPVTGAPVAGYGDSNSRTRYRYGVGGEYFFPAKVFFGADWIRNGDGVRIASQYLKSRDGEMVREGWYAQASYRFSFPERLLFDRYFRSIEPIARYGVYDVSTEPVPSLPGLWDRRRLALGAIIEVNREIFIRAEYVFNWEDTGGQGAVAGPTVGPSEVANDELMIELHMRF